MDLPPAVLTHLLQLVSSEDAESEALVAGVVALVADVRGVTDSYRGFQLRMVDHDWPTVLIVLTPDDTPIATSMRLPLDAVDRTYPAGSAIVFYAATPGALVDLATDLRHSLSMAGGGHPKSTISLDTDLPPIGQVSGFTGLEERSAINRAVGALIDRGHEPESAYRLLRREAAHAGVAIPSYARRLLSGD